ncbi:MAG: hypothetical protein H0T68_03625 [Gemmatimonadales bacterium]|nr:hypothetical protein [Gemmatimonadales bacterium]
MTRTRLTILVALALVGRGIEAQTSSPGGSTDTVTVAAGPQYEAGFFHRLFLGDHYRDLWTTPIPAEELDLASFAGGLEVTQRGGGQQTQSLRFKGADGRQYQFRSIDKDPTLALPPPLRRTAARDVVRDQASAGHPLGGLVVSPILGAAGVLHADPKVVILPKEDPRLGQFAEEFGGMLGTIEERPTDGGGDGDGFAGAAEVIDTKELLERTEDSPEDRVDAGAFLAARLIDLFVGDWDRHQDQWRWARFGEGRPRRWQPIPRDRDQAFVRFDGLLLSVARSSIPQLVNFGPDYPGMLGLTWNGRDLDRRFLVGLERPVWDSTASGLQARLTDSTIESAVATLPAAYLALDSARLAGALKQRRDELPEATRRYYHHLAGEVELHATDRNDVAVAERVDDRFTELSLTVADEGGAPGRPYYQRRFDRRETEEVRVFLHGGDDRMVVRGAGDGGVRVRVVPGKGTDALADSSRGGAVNLYSTEEQDQVLPGRSVAVSRKPYEPADTAVRDWGGRWLSQLWFDAGPDVGLFAGTGVSYTRYGFRHDPFAARYRLRAGYATGASTGRADFTAIWHRANSRVARGLLARASGVDVLRFNGFGNEIPAEGDEEFYRVNQLDLTLAPWISLPVARRIDLRIGPLLRYSDTDFDADRFISREPRPYGAGSFGMLGATADLRFDARNRPVAASHGAVLTIGGSVYPAALDVEDTFGELHAEAATYLTADSLPLEPTLALRAGGKRVWGRFPYQQAAFIGDASTVRLGRHNRYAGEASLYAGAELRLYLTDFFLLVPGDFGIFGLGDVGRVYLDGESSDRWHTAAGGGLWASFLDRANTLSLALAKSSERTAVYFRAGFGF